MAKKQKCPCCGRMTLMERGAFEICRICGWEDDPSQSADPTLDGGANTMSLLEAKRQYQTKRNAQLK